MMSASGRDKGCKYKVELCVKGKVVLLRSGISFRGCGLIRVIGMNILSTQLKQAVKASAGLKSSPGTYIPPAHIQY